MFHVHHIDSLDLPELAPYLTLKRPAEHETQGIFVAESEKVVRRLLESDFTVVSALLTQRWLTEFEPLLKARREDIAVYVVAQEKLLQSLVGFSLFQGVLAVGKIPPPASLDDVLAKSPRPQFFVAIDALANSENIGTLVRSCAAFGVQAMLVGETSSSPFMRRAVRNSMGTIFQMPVVVTPSLAETLRGSRARGVRCLAAHPQAGGKILSQADFTGDCCLVFGSEGHGISAPVLAACDEAVAIPMPAAVDSINVGAAAAVFLYEVSRQRGKPASSGIVPRG